MGYVGLPIALAFAKQYRVIAYDSNAERIAMLKRGIDPNGEIDSLSFDSCNLFFTSKNEDLHEATFHIIAVPTPVDSHKKPDLSQLLGATVSVAKQLKRGDCVVFESTVYPGCTEDDCIPLLESVSGLHLNIDFGVGYSPERINPGDKKHFVSNVVKIVSGSNDVALSRISAVYGSIIDAGVYKAQNIKIAESAKIIENTQRDVNIALMNELSIIFSKIDVNLLDVIQAASTKWNFLNFTPGLVGGHCIGVDPYYLDYKASELGYHTKMINSGRYVNDNMAKYVVKVVVKKLIANNIDVRCGRVLVLGATYKANVTDIRNSKSFDLVDEFKSFGLTVTLVDPLANANDVMSAYGVELAKTVEGSFDAVVLAVPHKCFLEWPTKKYYDLLMPNGVFTDIYGLLRGKIMNVDYWNL